jgi:hypothetical protein
MNRDPDFEVIQKVHFFTTGHWHFSSEGHGTAGPGSLAKPGARWPRRSRLPQFESDLQLEVRHWHFSHGASEHASGASHDGGFDGWAIHDRTTDCRRRLGTAVAAAAWPGNLCQRLSPSHCQPETAASESLAHIWKVRSCYVTCYIKGGVLYHIFLLYNMLYEGVT